MAPTKAIHAGGSPEGQSPLRTTEGAIESSSEERGQTAHSLPEMLESLTVDKRAGTPKDAPIAIPGRPLRVLHVVNSVGLGGTERGVLKIMEGLDPALFDQKVCAICTTSELGEHPAVRGKLLTAGKAENSGFEFLVLRLASIFRTFKPHIVHSRNWGGIEAVAAGRLAGVPVVVHSEHGYELDMMSGLPLRRRLLRRGFYSMCDAVFTVSGDLQTYHSRQGWLAPERIRVIPNGVDARLFAPNNQLRERMRERFGYGRQAVVLGAVGRLVPIKAHGTLLRAAEQLITQGMDVQVLLVGGGPELGRLREYALGSVALKDRATFAGPSLAVHELYQAMDVFVLPSIREGMSNTLLEAMACGLPCVATAVGSNGELVRDGFSGFVFTPEDVVGLVERLKRVVQQPETRATFAASARRHAVTFYSLDRMISAYADLYSELAMKRGLVARN